MFNFVCLPLLRTPLMCIWLVFFLISGVQRSLAHDIHLSLSEVRWNEETSAFEVAVKIFIDDLEMALKKENVMGLSIGSNSESDDANSHIASYLKKHFRIEANGVLLDQEFLGKEVSDDYLAIWCYVEIPSRDPRLRNVKMTNDILLDIYDDQRNIMDIRMNKQHKAYTILSAGQSSWTYSS